MACACKVTQQINYLQKKYGTTPPESKKTNIRGNFGPMMISLFGRILAILLSPLMMVYIIIAAIMGKKIRIDKFLKKKKDVGDNQVIQDKD